MTNLLRDGKLYERLQTLGFAPQVQAAPSTNFKARATESFVSKIRPNDARDPLLLQILPRPGELLTSPKFTADPVNDQSHMKVPGLIHKYANRVLLLASSSCPIHCRYCFRREFPYEASALSAESVARWCTYIAADPAIREVIFSGGDPFFTNLKALLSAVQQIAETAHVKVVRFHSRVPIAAPELVTDEFVNELATASRLRVVVVVHVNHANELDGEVLTALERLATRRFLLLSQTVLLKGVNDSARVLATLFERLVDIGVLPYYLNVLDQVTGTRDFWLSREEISAIYEELLTSCSGYTVPKLVRDEGKRYKSLYYLGGRA